MCTPSSNRQLKILELGLEPSFLVQNAVAGARAGEGTLAGAALGAGAGGPSCHTDLNRAQGAGQPFKKEV